jgi:ankyrin repeat protein
MVVQLLLDKQADVNAKGGEFGNALQAASVYGHRKVVQMLLDRGADVNAHGGLYGNALQAASECGHDMVVRKLLDRGADVTAHQGGGYRNALLAAPADGHEKEGADAAQSRGRYRSPRRRRWQCPIQ